MAGASFMEIGPQLIQLALAADDLGDLSCERRSDGSEPEVESLMR
jgi:hypothetical protein